MERVNSVTVIINPQANHAEPERSFLSLSEPFRMPASL